VITPTPGFDFQIWGTDRVPRSPTRPSAAGYPAVEPRLDAAGSGVASATTTLRLSHVRERVYYLLWITSLGPDPTHAGKSVQIAEFELRQRT